MKICAPLAFIFISTRTLKFGTGHVFFLELLLSSVVFVLRMMLSETAWLELVMELGLALVASLVCSDGLT